MIKFFRKIRQELMETGKTGKYLKYAIGEIILVVVGIVIALQLNNWNEVRKEGAYEIKMLNEIKLGLDGDIPNFENIIRRLKRLDSASNHFLDLIYQKAPFIDSLYNKASFEGRWYLLRTGVLYRYNRGPYEALKTSGLDKVSNEKLRNDLIQLYDYEWPRHEEFFRWSDKDYEKDGDMLDSFLEPKFIEVINGEKHILSKFPRNTLQNPNFLILIDELRFRASSQIGYIQRHLDVLKIMRNQLEEELAKQ